MRQSTGAPFESGQAHAQQRTNLTDQQEQTMTARAALRKQIATDIYNAVEQAPMSFIADGGETATILAELILRRINDAGYQHQPLIRTKAELDALPEGSAVIDESNDISTKHNDAWHGYETAPITSHRLAKYGPLHVIHIATEAN